MQVALTGLSQSGKSTLFSALTGSKPSADYGAAQVEKAVVKVPDERLDVLTDLFKPKKTTPATIEILDLPGLSFVDEPSRAEARRIIAQARQADMLVWVVRDFDNASVPAYRDKVDAASNVDELRSELLLADLELVTNRIEKLKVSITKPTKRQDLDKKELALLERCNEAIENLQPISDVVQNDEENKMLRSFGFLSQKPTIVVLNVDEDKVGEPASLSSEQAGAEVLALAATIEAELAALDEEERGAFMEDMNVTEIARERLIRTCYQAVQLISFLTVGEDEVRAWSIPAGCPAVEAAGAIHSDIQRGFIRAETVSYDDFLAVGGSMKDVKAAGKFRLEGKTYQVQDGDIINFRFNV